MTPLIQTFTKNLSPCGSCGSNGVDYFIEQSAKGEKVQFILQVQVEADDLTKAITGDRSQWSVVAANPIRPNPQPGQNLATVLTGGKTSGQTFQQTTTVPAPS